MKPLFPVFLCVLFLNPFSFSQCPAPTALSTQDGNNISAYISNGGDLFWDGDNGLFIAPAEEEPPKSSIFAAALWMGGIAEDGQLKLAAQTYGRANGAYDYITGPLAEDGTINEDDCNDFDKIWKVTKAEIEAHKADFADNGVLDDPIQSIFAWPGRGSLDFFNGNGFPLPNYQNEYAPFHDTNGNNIYEPGLGDYPHSPKTISGLTPASITWSIFNDNTTHTQTGGIPIQAEIHLTSWSFDCPLNRQLDNTIFTSHRIINKSAETLDSFHVSLWVDFDLGCYLDDYMGSSPEHNAFFTYNSDDLDGESSAEDCQGVETYGYNIPTQSIQFLNKSLDYFTFYNNGGILPPPCANIDPGSAQQYFSYMNGRWLCGDQITYGGDGYDPNSTDYTNYVFPDNPNDPDGWSMKQEGFANGDRRIVATHDHGSFEMGESIEIDIAYTFHKYETISNHSEVIDKMYPNIEKVQQMYDMQFNGWCGVVTNTEEPLFSNINITPNPSSGFFNVNTNDLKINELILYDINGRLVWKNNDTLLSSGELDFSFLKNGIYILQMNSENGISTEKLIIQK